MRTTATNPYTPPRFGSGTKMESPRLLQWQIAPATLSVSLGVIILLMNCIHLRDAMIPEIQRAFDPSNGFTIAHGLLCMLSSSLFFAASACAFVASRHWMDSRYRTALMLEALGIPVLLSAGVFLMYFQI